ncbi:MAG: hypothetical protein ACXWXT_18885, partial [Candidatus Binatia bacterium]
MDKLGVLAAKNLARHSRNQLGTVFTTKCFMILRSPTEHENGWHSQNMIPLNSSFPLTRESRFVLRRISLDTRFRGYDGAPQALCFAYHPLRVFSKEVTKDTKVSENYFYELRALRT